MSCSCTQMKNFNRRSSSMVNLDPGGRSPSVPTNGRREAWNQHQGSCGQSGGMQQSNSNGGPQKGNFDPNRSCSQQTGLSQYQISGNSHNSHGQLPRSYNGSCSQSQSNNGYFNGDNINTNNPMPQANYNYSHPCTSRPNNHMQQSNHNPSHPNISRHNDHMQQANYNHSHANNSRPNDHMQQGNYNHSHSNNSRLNNHMQQSNHNSSHPNISRPNDHMQQANYNHSHSNNSRPNDHMQQSNHNPRNPNIYRPNDHMQQANYNHSHSNNSTLYDHMQQANHNHSHANNSRPNDHMQQANYYYGHAGDPKSNDHMQQANHNYGHASSSGPNDINKDFYRHGVTSQHNQKPLGNQNIQNYNGMYSNEQCGQRKDPSYTLNNPSNKCSRIDNDAESQHRNNYYGGGREYEQSKNSCGFNPNEQGKYWTQQKTSCNNNQQISNTQPYQTSHNTSFQNKNNSLHQSSYNRENQMRQNTEMMKPGQPNNSWSQRRSSGGNYKSDGRTSDCSCCKSAGQLDPPMKKSSSSNTLNQEYSHQRSKFYGSQKDFHQNESHNDHHKESRIRQDDDSFKMRRTAGSHSLYNPCRYTESHGKIDNGQKSLNQRSKSSEHLSYSMSAKNYEKEMNSYEEPNNHNYIKQENSFHKPIIKNPPSERKKNYKNRNKYKDDCCTNDSTDSSKDSDVENNLYHKNPKYSRGRSKYSKERKTKNKYENFEISCLECLEKIKQNKREQRKKSYLEHKKVGRERKAPAPTVPRSKPSRDIDLGPYHSNCFQEYEHISKKERIAPAPTVPRSKPKKDFELGPYHKSCLDEYENITKYERKAPSSTIPREKVQKNIDLGPYHKNCLNEYEDRQSYERKSCAPTVPRNVNKIK